MPSRGGQDCSDLGEPLVIDLLHERGRELRTAASVLPDMANNLAISNMDLFEFADAVHADGAHRGF